MKRRIATVLIAAAVSCSVTAVGVYAEEAAAESVSADQEAAVMGQETSEEGKAEAASDAALEDGVYMADFDTDSGMFHVSEACDGKGTLTVEDGKMTIHISLGSKNIVNLFPGLAADAQKEGAEILQPTTDSVTYSDGITEEVFGFDVPVPALDEEFDLALIGKKGTWYDHKVIVSNPVESGASVSAAETEYPLTITTYDYEGNEVETTYEKAPEKVLAVYQGCIETMLALGLEDHMVAAAGLDNEVPEEQKAAFDTLNYLDEFTPSLETATMLEPDMIFSWGSIWNEEKLGAVSNWIEKGCNTYINTNTRPNSEDVKHDRTLENEYTDILNIGKIFNVQDKAEAIVADIQSVVNQTLEATKDMEEKTSVMIVEPIGDGITNYGKTSLGGDMVTSLGAELANPDAPSVGKEDIVAANPDVIFVVYMPYSGDDPETVKTSQLNTILEDEAYQSLDAVKNGRVYPIMLSEMYASATRTQDGIETFARNLYPDLELAE